MMLPHEAAQSAAGFALVIFIGIGVVLWMDYRKEVKHAQKQVAKGTQPRG